MQLGASFLAHIDQADPRTGLRANAKVAKALSSLHINFSDQRREGRSKQTCKEQPAAVVCVEPLFKQQTPAQDKCSTLQKM